jgi:hypothetical protein
MLRKLQETNGNSKSVSPPFTVVVSICIFQGPIKVQVQGHF